MGQAVASFDLGEEPLSHEEALLFKGGRKHHIFPQLVLPSRLAHDRRLEKKATPGASCCSTNAKIPLNA
jgi:hypothetical protein